MEDDWANPFDSNENEFVGISISTGNLAPQDVAREYLMRTKLAWQHTKNSSDTDLKMAKGSVP